MDYSDYLQSLKRTIIFVFSIAFSIPWQSVIAMTISAGSTMGVPSSYDPVTNTTIFTATQTNTNLNYITLQNALTNNNVSIRDDFDQNIVLSGGTRLIWGTSFNLTINARYDIVIENQAQIISQRNGNLVLRANVSGDNEGTLKFPNEGELNIAMNGGGCAKVFYRPKDYSTPTDFRENIYTTAPELLIANMAINNFGDLQKMNDNLAGNYALSRNIDAMGQAFAPIGTASTPFTGSFDGQGYRINRLLIYSANADNVGLFGYTMNATIQNVGLLNVNVAGRNNVGGLVGYNGNTIFDSLRGSIRQTFAEGNVSGYSQVGGLVGRLSKSTVAQSYSNGTVLAVSGVPNQGGGGLVGIVDGAIVDSYTMSRITPESNITEMGGLFGAAAANVVCSNDYVAGQIIVNTFSGAIMSSGGGSFLGLFWDTETTGRAYPSRGTQQIPGIKGLTKLEMFNKSNFENAGWDFDTVWRMNNENEYPHLLWTELAPPWTTMPSETPNTFTIVN